MTKIVAKFSTLQGGLFVEETGPERKECDRCFRFDEQGNAEYCFFKFANDLRPRFYGHAFKENQFILA